MNSKIRAYRFLQWMMRTPILGKDQVLSKEHPQVVMLKKAFDQHAAEARAEQREACAANAIKQLINKPRARYPEGTLSTVEDACLNAVEKEDE